MVVGLSAVLAPASATVAVNPITPGKWTATSTEYKFPASVDREVVPEGGTKTELWARVWYPTGKPLPATGAPIVVMLHGNHPTCGHLDTTGKWYIDDNAQYSVNGTCPAASPRVSPEHLGYDYLGVQLATQGYVVISINVNRGINETAGPSGDEALIFRRARMILRHLQALTDWNNGAGPSPVPSFVAAVKGKLDFSHVSLFGHSRGGDAIVAAYYLFQNDTDTWRTKRLAPSTSIVALAAVAPTGHVADLNVPGQPPLGGVAYGVLLPMCDGDVTRLEGVQFYDRGVAFVPGGPGLFRATFAAWGAEHNAFNTEWHTHDAYAPKTGDPGTQTCPGQTPIFPYIGTSAQQKAVALYFTEAIIRARSNAPAYGQLLNPEYGLPGDLPSMTSFDRGYFPGLPANSALRLIKFDAPNKGDCAAKLFTYPGAIASCGVPPEHDYDPSDLTASSNTWIARIRWGAPAVKTAASGGYYYAGIVLNGGVPVDLSRLKTLEMRMGPDCTLQVPAQAGYDCINRSGQDKGKDGSQNVMFILQDQAGTYSSYVPALAHTNDRASVGLKESPINDASPTDPLYHAIMSSVRVPIADFLTGAPSTFDLKHITNIYLLLSPDGGVSGPNPTGGIFLGDIWADTLNVAASSAPALSKAPGPLPPRSSRIAATVDLPTNEASPAATVASEPHIPADQGNLIVGAERKSVASSSPLLGSAQSAQSQKVKRMVEFTLQSRKQLLDNDSGFYLVIGGKAIKADFTYRAIDPNVVKLAIPVEAFESAADGSSVTVASGASRWHFGAFSKATAH